MRETSGLSRADRLSHLSLLLYRHPQGLTAAELARLCGVTVRTIQRDLNDLEAAGVPLWDDAEEPARGAEPPRYGILDGYYLPPIRLTLDDALALYLAGRLLARYADAYDPHIAQALAKLAGILPEPLARHIQATIRQLATRPDDDRLVHVLGQLTLGWATGRMVRIRYQAAKHEDARVYDLCPYLIEPSAVSHATYVLGHAQPADALRTFKVERILEAKLTDRWFTVPDTFDGPALLATAWGIEYGDEPVEVALRFAPSATRRLKETHWHPTQQLDDLPDGGCLLRLRVAHPEEMVYWVRGWGPQVEVLAPAWLREQMAQEAGELNDLYEAKGTRAG